MIVEGRSAWYQYVLPDADSESLRSSPSVTDLVILYREQVILPDRNLCAACCRSLGFRGFERTVVSLRQVVVFVFHAGRQRPGGGELEDNLITAKRRTAGREVDVSCMTRY